MTHFNRIVYWLAEHSVIAAIIALVAMMAVIVANIIKRFFGTFLWGTYDLVGVMSAVLVSFALAYAALTGSHITIEFLTSRFSRRVQATLEIFNSAISIGIWALVGWASAHFAREMWLKGEVTETLKFPVFPFRYIWVFALLVLCLVLLRDLFNAFRQAVRK